MELQEQQHVGNGNMHIPFFPNEPDLWFVQVEANFAMRGITSQKQKFNCAVASLPASLVIEMKDVLLNPPSSSQYDRLKEEIIGRTAVSQQKKLQQLLHTEMLGDRKPSQLLRRMRSLAGNNQDESLLKHIFLERLPPQIHPILAALDSSLSLDKVADIADQVLDRTPPPPPTIAAVSRVAEDSALVTAMAKMTERMAEMTVRLEEMSCRIDRRRSPSRERYDLRSPSRERYVQRSPSRERYIQRSPGRERDNRRYPNRERRFVGGYTGPPSVCHFHRRFGEQAQFCKLPCAFKKPAEN